jgi:hypothetical protein
MGARSFKTFELFNLPFDDLDAQERRARMIRLAALCSIVDLLSQNRKHGLGIMFK